jgi:hypothetical protein
MTWWWFQATLEHLTFQIGREQCPDDLRQTGALPKLMARQTCLNRRLSLKKQSATEIPSQGDSVRVEFCITGSMALAKGIVSGVTRQHRAIIWSRQHILRSAPTRFNRRVGQAISIPALMR